MTDRKTHRVHLELNAESLPGDFEAELIRLDRALGEALCDVDVPAGLSDRVYSMSAEFLEAPAALPFARPTVHVVARQRRTMWARLGVAASLALLCLPALHVMMNSGTPNVSPNQPEMVVASTVEKPLPGAVEMLLLDRCQDCRGEELAYLFDPDPRESSDMSLFVQTRELTLDDVSVELAMLEAEFNM